MERKVPSTATEEIDLYLRTIYSLLRSTTEVQIRTLEEVHAGMNSSLHLEARNQVPDTSAFIYSIMRLPACILDVRSIILGQSASVFEEHGISNIESWQETSARARRRRVFFNGTDTLACYIASRSDIDDVVPTLTAYQIEWNKLHSLLQRCPECLLSDAIRDDPDALADLAERMEVSGDDLHRLQVVWGDAFLPTLRQIASRRCSFRVRLLEGSMTEYWRATRAWMENIVRACPDLLTHPVYFVSSNTHSLANLLSGYALQIQSELIRFLKKEGDESLLAEWADIQESQIVSNQSNFLYYVLKKYQGTPAGAHALKGQILYEQDHGIYRIESIHSFDVEAQVIDLSRIDPTEIDPRLTNGNPTILQDSNALILNIDYPLGLSAYNILAKVTEYANPVLGVYVMGKAATLNGVMGDIMIPNVVQDEHSLNTYLFQNVFSAADVSPFLAFGTVLDNQKAVSVLGTFLQNARIMDVFYREGYTDFEMEAGPYLSAISEMVRPNRHPNNEIINLYNAPFDIGFIHYVSDTPLSKGKNLGAGSLSYFGMDSTYACSVAILKRIFEVEEKRIGG